MRTLAAAVFICAVAVDHGAAQPRPKQLKDQAEHDLYNQALQDAADPSKQIQVLDNWTRRYPSSDYKDERLYLYMQAHSKLNPPESARVVQLGGQLMSRDLNALFAGPGGARVVLNVLFSVAWHVAAIPAPSADDLALGRKAARELLAMLARYKPENTSDEDWAQARADITHRVSSALVAMALAPGNQAMSKNPPDCAAAETVYRQALAEYNEALPAYNLGRALSCQGRYPEAIYQFVRAAVIDPSVGGGTAYAVSLYVTYHGSDDGLAQLREAGKTAPLPPDGFTIETAAAIEARKQSEFAKNHPHAALWMAIRRQLTAENGRQYFEGQLKNTLVSLKGTVAEGRPQCRPKELLVTIPAGAQAELILRLDTPVPGQIVPGEIAFEAVPRLFAAEPFLITADAVRARIVNLKSMACAP